MFDRARIETIQDFHVFYGTNHFLSNATKRVKVFYDDFLSSDPSVVFYVTPCNELTNSS